MYKGIIALKKTKIEVNNTVEIHKYNTYNRFTYQLGTLHAIFLFLIHLPFNADGLLEISWLQKQYIGWGPIYGTIFYLMLGGYLRYFYAQNETMKKHNLYLKNYLAIILSVCVAFWVTTMEIPEQIGSGNAEGLFKALLFIGFLLLLPYALAFRSSIILPFILGYKIVGRYFKPQRLDPEIDTIAWHYVLTGEEVI